MAHNAWRESRGQIVEDFEITNDWSVNANCTVSVNTNAAYIKTGDGSIKVQSNVSGALNVATRTGLDIRFQETSSPDPVLSWWLYIDDIANFGTGGINIYLSSNGFSKYFQTTISYYGLKTGWNHVKVSATDWSNTGGESFTNTFTDLRFNWTNASGKTGALYIDSMYDNAKSKAYCMIFWDDCYQSAYDKIYKYGQDRGIKSIWPVVSELIGYSTYLSEETLKKIYEDGNDVINHTSDHTNLTTLTESGMTTKIGDCYNFLDGLGLDRSKYFFAYPQNAYNESASNVLATLGYKMARAGKVDTQQIPIELDPWNGKPYALNTSLELTSATTTTSVSQVMTEAINRGGICCIYAHKVEDTPDEDLAVSTTVAQYMYDYLNTNADDIATITFSDLYKLTNDYDTLSTATEIGGVISNQDLIPPGDYLDVRPTASQQAIVINTWGNNAHKVYMCDNDDNMIEVNSQAVEGGNFLFKHFATEQNYVTIKNTSGTQSCILGYSGARIK